jgi:cytochrome c-type biogenesis protein CcmH/NrfG
MADTSLHQATPQTGWKANQAYAMAIVFLLVGLLAGYLLRGSSSPNTPAAAAQPATAQPPAQANGAHPMPTMEQMKQMADAMAAPLLEKSKAAPNDAKLLLQIAGIYNKAHQFRDAAGYYNRALQLHPKDVETRNEMASCLYYSGDVDGALAQLQQSLKTDPKNVNALFNLGMIRWRGKDDSKGAVAAWQQLLKANPGLDRKPIVEKMIAEATTQVTPAN